MKKRKKMRMWEGDVVHGGIVGDGEGDAARIEVDEYCVAREVRNRSIEGGHIHYKRNLPLFGQSRDRHGNTALEGTDRIHGTALCPQHLFGRGRDRMEHLR